MPKITVNNDIVTIDVDTETILTQDTDYNKTVALRQPAAFQNAKYVQPHQF